MRARVYEHTFGEGFSNCPRHLPQYVLDTIMRFSFENALCFTSAFDYFAFGGWKNGCAKRFIIRLPICPTA